MDLTRVNEAALGVAWNKYMLCTSASLGALCFRCSGSVLSGAALVFFRFAQWIHVFAGAFPVDCCWVRLRFWLLGQIQID